MTYIYYPEYELESIGLVKQPNHIINLKLLLLICDKVIIPATHFLRTSIFNIVSLDKWLSPFFDDGKIITSIYTENKNIQDYFHKKVEFIEENNVKKLLISHTKYVTDVLFQNTNIKHHKREFNNQLFLFHKTFDEYIKEDAENNQNKSYQTATQTLLHKIDEHCNHTGVFITYDELHNLITTFYNTCKIAKPQKERIMNLLERSYFFCGAMTLDSTISYNQYFEKIDFQNISKNTKNPSSLMVSPSFLLTLLLKLSIIDSAEDLLSLGSNEYDQLKSYGVWNEFMNYYYSICKSIDTLESCIEEQSNIAKKMEKRKDMWHKIGLLLSGSVLGIPFGFLTLNPLASLGIEITGGLAGIGFDYTKLSVALKNKTTDKIINRLYQKREPLYVFCEKLKATIEKCQ